MGTWIDGIDTIELNLQACLDKLQEQCPGSSVTANTSASNNSKYKKKLPAGNVFLISSLTLTLV
jgi:hypothetical protein